MLRIKRLLTGIVSIFIFAVVIFASNQSAVFAISGADLDSIKNNTPFYDPNDTLNTTCSGGSSTVLSGSGNAEKIFNYFVSKGLTGFQAAGIMGNMWAESGLNPRALQPGTTGDFPISNRGYGLVQWTDDWGSSPTPVGRQKGLVDMAQKEGKPVYDLGVQLDNVWRELTEVARFKDVITGLKDSKNVVEATRIIEDDFEVHAGGPQPDRITHAKQYLALYGSTTPEQAGPVETTSTPDGCNTDATVGPDGWVWPAKDNIYPGNCWNAYVSGLGYHAGMDINSSVDGNRAMAASNGKVVSQAFDEYAGNYVTVKTKDGLYYSYEHLASTNVKLGDTVAAGQTIIGIIGKTGRVFLGPTNHGHLHFVVAASNTLGSYSQTSQKFSQTRDPLDYLPKNAPDNYKCEK